LLYAGAGQALIDLESTVGIAILVQLATGPLQKEEDEAIAS
jgi:hypothetical protein